MALDKNLFTLNLEPSKIEPSALDLVDPSGTVHYRKRFIPDEAGKYLFSLSDPLSDSILATATAPTATSKEKIIELHNPSVIVPLNFKGTLTFKWAFTWEEHEFEWKREACYMIRKPDPPVLVAVTKEPAGKIKTSTVQILDYNLNRFDIDDRKGLEILLLTSLLTFGDHSEQLRTKPSDVPSSVANMPPSSAAPVPPAPPPKPEGWKEDQIAILQAKEQRDVNEVVIGETGNVDEYVKHCVSLLNDDTLLFITLRSLTPNCVSKVVQVAETTKRTRYKNSGYDDDEELHQYVDMSFVEEAGKQEGKKKGKGPRVINLDDRPASAPTAPSTTAYQPPNTLTIHLSKIAMPELEPKVNKAKNLQSNTSSFGRRSQAASEPELREPAQLAKEQKHGRRQSSATGGGSTTLMQTPPPASTPSPSGLRARLGVFKSRSSSPPSKAQPTSVPQQRLAQPQSPLQPQSQPQSQPQPQSQSQPQRQSQPQPQRQPQPQQPPSHLRPEHSPQGLQRPQHPSSQAQFKANSSRPPHLQHAHSHPPSGPAPLLNTQPTFPPRPHSTLYPSPQNARGYTPPHPGPGSLTAQPANAYSMYPAFAGASTLSPPQRKGFFGGPQR